MASSDHSPQALRATGGCFCGAVRFEVTGPLRDVVLCHCEMCRRTHGHVAAYSATPRERLRLIESRALKWHASSTKARRGFCAECGSRLFWDSAARDYVSIAAGALDAPTGLATSLQVHTASAGDYYAIDESVPRRGD